MILRDTFYLDILTEESLIKSLKEEIKSNWTKFNNNLQEQESKKEGMIIII